MVVIKAGEPIRKAFIKAVMVEGEDGEFRELEVGQEDDPLQDERVQEHIERRLEEERAVWEEQKQAELREAFERGAREGAEAEQQKVWDKLTLLAELVSGLQEQWAEFLRREEETVVGLSLAISRRFVGSASALSPDLIKDAIKSAVKMITEKEKVLIRISPDDLEEVRNHQDDIIFIGDGIGKLEIRGDSAVERGGCVIETEAGNIDARVGSRFDEIEKALRRAVSNGNGNSGGGRTGGSAADGPKQEKREEDE